MSKVCHVASYLFDVTTNQPQNWKNYQPNSRDHPPCYQNSQKEDSNHFPPPAKLKINGETLSLTLCGHGSCSFHALIAINHLLRPSRVKWFSLYWRHYIPFMIIISSISTPRLIPRMLFHVSRVNRAHVKPDIPHPPNN